MTSYWTIRSEIITAVQGLPTYTRKSILISLEVNDLFGLLSRLSQDSLFVYFITYRGTEFNELSG